MAKVDKAEDFYLRGYKSNYIRRRTGIGTQSLLKQLLASGVRYTDSDIVDYQVNYIESRFTKDDVANAYLQISSEYGDDIYKASRRNEIIILGCCFGNHVEVFSRILGRDEFMLIK